MPPPEEPVPRFIGRSEVVETLRHRLERVLSGDGGFTLVVGDVGVGKSTLVQALAHESRAKGLDVLIGKVPALENPPPLHLIHQAIRDAGTASPASPSSLARPPTLAFVVPRQAHEPVTLGFAPRAGGGEETETVEGRILEDVVTPFSVEEGGHRWVFAQLADRILSRAEAKPTLLVLEDLQAADLTSLEFLEYFAPQIEGHPLWVVATCLPRGSLSELLKITLEHLEQSTRSDEVVLRPLTAPELGEFVRTLDGRIDLKPEELTRWHSQTGGNPLFVEQILRTRRERGSGRTFTDAPERELGEYLARQVGELTDEEQRVLGVAAVLGKEFAFSLWLKASSADEERLAEISERLIGRGILREQSDERFEFVREDLRAQIYGGMTESRRRVLHRHAGEALEATGFADVATIYALARHFYLGRVDGKAVLYNRSAGEFAAATFAHEVARVHFERALECLRRMRPHEPETEIEILLLLAIQLDRIGELKAAEHALREVLDRPKLLAAAKPAQRTLLHVSLARIVSDEGRMDEADRMTQELVRNVGDNDGPALHIAVHRIRGEALYYLGRYEESLHHHDQALSIARREGDAREIALETQRHANVLGMIPGRFEEAVKSSRIAGESLERLGDLAEAAYARMFLGVLLSQHGRVEEGLAELETSVRLAEKAHDLRRVGWALFNIADLLREAGRAEEGVARNARARQILERAGDRFGLIQTRIIGGKILLALGQIPEAEVELLEAYRLSRDLNAPADEVDVVLRLAEVAWARGDKGAAETRIHELDRRGLTRLRPDLAPDFDRLKLQVREGARARA